MRPSALLLVFLLTSASLSAQPRQEYEVTSLRFSGNDELHDDLLRAAMRTQESPSWFWKFIYHNLSERLGQQPEYFDRVAWNGDFTYLRRYYEEQGFFQARIDTNIRFAEGANEVTLQVRIDEGPRSHIDTLRYQGLEGLPTQLLTDIGTNPLIEPGDPFILSDVEDELKRVVNAFVNQGFVSVRVDTVIADRYASTNNFTVVFRFIAGPRYQFGALTIEQDSLSHQRIPEGIIVRHLDFAPGDVYSENKKVESERNLNRLGIFEGSQIDNRPIDRSGDTLVIPIRVVVRTRPFQELTPEVGVNDDQNALNILTGIGYNHRNFFGGARNFTLRFRFSLQSIENVRLAEMINGRWRSDTTFISKMEVSAEVTQPYFINNKTTIGNRLSATLEKKDLYFQPIINNRLSVASQVATYTRSLIDWELEWSDPRSVRTGRDTTLEAFGVVQQFNSILGLTLQWDMRNDLFNPSDGFIHSGTLEEAGILPKAFGRSLGITLPYSQYIKLSGVGLWYWDPTVERDFIWAMKLRGGAAVLYGGSTIDVPVTRRFFSGGSGSVRGWRVRDLGAVPEPRLGGNALLEASIEGRWGLFQGAGRFLFLDLDKLSLVFFLDAGNIWPKHQRVRLDEIALASGFGLRFNTIAGPIRIDFGMKMYDPGAGPGRRWVGDKRFFPETFGAGVIHLGVGHAF